MEMGKQRVEMRKPKSGNKERIENEQEISGSKRGNKT